VSIRQADSWWRWKASFSKRENERDDGFVWLSDCLGPEVSKRDGIHIHHYKKKKESHGFVFLANFGTFCWRDGLSCCCLPGRSVPPAWLAFGEAFSRVRAFVRSGREVNEIFLGRGTRLLVLDHTVESVQAPVRNSGVCMC
jgi:hypothetical protein